MDEIRHAYETIYTQMSPFTNIQLSYGTNTAVSISNALTHGASTGTSYTQSSSTTDGTSTSKSFTTSYSVSKKSFRGNLVKTLGTVALGVASIATAPLTGGASLAAAGAIIARNSALSAYEPPTKTKVTSSSESTSENHSTTSGTSYGSNKTSSVSTTQTNGTTSGKTQNMQLTQQNKTLINTLERIDLQLKRLDECESLGMWECAAYFLSDSQATAEMAAGTYKALMKGSKSGVETSAINFWGRNNNEKLPILRDYITNFVHPIFAYKSAQGDLPVSASSLVSSNELAIQMGLPRKSVCGFPVIEHADFGKEVVCNEKRKQSRDIIIGKIFSMGTQTNTGVNLDINSLGQA